MAIAASPTLEDEQLAMLDALAEEFQEAFQELSARAERELPGRTFVFSSYGRELYPYFEATDADQVLGA